METHIIIDYIPEKKSIEIEYMDEELPTRYAIADSTGNIIDNAQGYGFKTRQKAYLAMQWKFNGGSDRAANNKESFNSWVNLEPIHKEVIKRYNNLMDIHAIEISQGETEMSEIWDCIKEEYPIDIPEYIKKELAKR